MSIDELALGVLALADQPPPSSSTLPIVLGGIIAAAGLILSTTLPVLIARLRREPPPAHDPNEPDWEARATAYATFLSRRGIRPSSIVTGEENDDDVRY